MKHLLFILAAFSLLSACDTNNSGSTENNSNAILVASTGGVDELMFVMNKGLLPYSDSIIRDEFDEIYTILPQQERIFDVTTVEFGKMNGLLYRFRNTVYITARGAEDGVNQLAQDILSEEEWNSGNSIFYKRDVWAKDQLIVFIIAPSIQEINSTIASFSPTMMKTISDSELPAYTKLAYINGTQEKLKEQIKGRYGVNFSIPADFQLAKNEGNFISVRKDADKSIVFIWFDVEEYSAPPEDFNRGIEMRNERGRFATSDEPDSYMVADNTYGVFTERKEKDGLIIYENRGLWTMENDFKGGPFINQYIIDQANNRVFLLDGFSFGPGAKNKKQIMRQFEAIFATFSLVD